FLSRKPYMKSWIFNLLFNQFFRIARLSSLYVKIINARAQAANVKSVIHRKFSADQSAGWIVDLDFLDFFRRLEKYPVPRRIWVHAECYQSGRLGRQILLQCIAEIQYSVAHLRIRPWKKRCSLPQ